MLLAGVALGQQLLRNPAPVRQLWGRVDRVSGLHRTGQPDRGHPDRISNLSRRLDSPIGASGASVLTDSFVFDAFSCHEPAPTPDRVRGRLLLENAPNQKATATGAAAFKVTRSKPDAPG